MKTSIHFILCILVLQSAFSQQPINIIPQPQSLETREGSFPLHQAKLILPADAKAKRVAVFFSDAVKQQTGIALTTNRSTPPAISFSYKKSIADPEGYEISIQPKAIRVQAATDKGLFWAVQTLRQLLPLEKTGAVELPCLQVKDAPKYGWRSNMLDVSRHFFSVDFIKKHIDILSFYKINTFH